MNKKRLPIQNIVLRTLLVTGIIGTALIAPNAIQLFAHLDRGKKRRKELYRRIDQARYRLARKDLIRITGKRVALTERGKHYLQKIRIGGYEIKEPFLWDAKWRVIVFDVTERRRKLRNALRALLQKAGFVRLQDSVWVHPYPCDEFVELLRSYLRSGSGEILFFTADSFAGDRRLRDEFSLS